MRLRRAKRHAEQQGFILIEAMIAIVILALAISSLAALMVQVSRSSLRVTGDSYKNGILSLELNRLESVPYDALAAGVSTVSVSELPYPHTRTVTVTDYAVNVKKVTVVITPTRTYFLKDSTTLYRRNAVPTTALNTGL